MGCSRCRKTTPPLGSKTPTPPPEPPRPPSGAVTKPTTAKMPTSQTFTLQTIDGRTMTFGSRLEAEATRIRSGGGTIL